MDGLFGGLMEQRYRVTLSYMSLDELLDSVNRMAEWDLFQVMETESLGIKRYKAVLVRNQITYSGEPQ